MMSEEKYCCTCAAFNSATFQKPWCENENKRVGYRDVCANWEPCDEIVREMEREELQQLRQQLQAAEEQIKAMRSCGNCLNYGDNPDKCEFCIVNGMNNWEWDGYKGVE